MPRRAGLRRERVIATPRSAVQYATSNTLSIDETGSANWVYRGYTPDPGVNATEVIELRRSGVRWLVSQSVWNANSGVPKAQRRQLRLKCATFARGVVSLTGAGVVTTCFMRGGDCVSSHSTRSIATERRKWLPPSASAVWYAIHHSPSNSRIPGWLVVSAERAARGIVRGVARRRREVVVTPLGKLAVFFQRHAPWLVSGAIRRFGVRSRSEPSRP